MGTGNRPFGSECVTLQSHVILAAILLAISLVPPAAAADLDLASEANTTIYGGVYPGGAGDLSGWELTAGDLDGDGKADLLVSAPYADGPSDTRFSTMDLWLFFGRDRGDFPGLIDATAAADVVFYGGFNLLNTDSHFSGWDVASGDIDGDGFDDLAFSAPNADGPFGDRNSTGAIYIYYGRPRASWGSVYDTMGEVGPAADIEIYGADENDSIGGTDLAIDEANVSKSLALGDITGDGKAEILFGAVYADGPGNLRNSSGDVYIVFGNTREALTNLITVRPEDPGRHADVALYGRSDVDFFGFSLAVGDYDGDAVGDLGVGALYSDGPANNFRNGCGDVWIYFGQPAAAWAASYDVGAGEFDRTIQGRAENGHAPFRLAAGDLDGDGKDDLVLSTPHNRIPVRPKAGEHQVLFGRDRGAWPLALDLATGADVWFQGRDNTDAWGTVSVARWEIGCDVSLGDVDGDGRDDLLVGAKFGDSINNSRPNAGEALLILGRPRADFEPVYDLALDSSIIESNLWGAEFGVTGDFYHYDAAGHAVLIADLTGDGTSDLILSAPFADGPSNSRPEAGETYVVFTGDAAAVAEGPAPAPARSRLEIAPNPFHEAARISFSLAATATETRIEIFDAQGRKVRNLFDESAPPEGVGAVVWDGRNDRGQLLASGIYLARLTTGSESPVTTRLVLAR